MEIKRQNTINVKLNDNELIELGRYIIESIEFDYSKEKLILTAERTIEKLQEIQARHIIIKVSYLKISQVKNNTREFIDKLSGDAVLKLIDEVLKVHLKRKPVKSDIDKLKISHEITVDNKLANETNKRFVYFPEGELLGEYLNVKEGEYFKLVFRFTV